MERLRILGASPDPSTSLGLPMSGLILNTPTDCIRIWHSEDGEYPPIETDSLRAFCRQAPTTQYEIFTNGNRPLRLNSLAILWDGHATKPVLRRLDLVRPFSYLGRKALVDWRVSVMNTPPQPSTRNEPIDLGI